MSRRELKRIKKGNKLKNLLGIAILGILFYIGIYIGIGIYKEFSIDLLEENVILVEKMSEVKEISPVIPIIIDTVPETYLNFEVIAKLEIPKINFNSNVLKEYREDGMKLCISKFFRT